MSAAATSRRKQVEILGKLAVGGMAEIFLARSSGVGGFQKYVVLKRILPQFAQDDAFVKMFLDEARVSALLQHQNIAQVHDIGEDNGTYFFTMEYLHGVDLRHLVSHLQSRGIDRPPLSIALTVIAGALSGLHYAHDKIAPNGQPLNIVHRDVSLSNIVVTYDGGVKLVDFGVARANARDTRTRTGSLKGKVGYMSPEQCRGKRIDRRSDLFSLGVVLFELTTGCRPFAGNTEETSDYSTILQIVEENPTLPSELVPGFPSELEDIILRALTKDPDDRYPTARSMLADIEAFAANQRIPLSTSSLAGFMEEHYGRPPEPWHNLQAHERPTEIGEGQVKRTISFAPPDDEETADTVLGGSSPSVSGIERTVMADSQSGVNASAVRSGSGANVQPANRPTVMADASQGVAMQPPPNAPGPTRALQSNTDPAAYFHTAPAPGFTPLPGARPAPQQPAMGRVEPAHGYQIPDAHSITSTTSDRTRERSKKSSSRKLLSVLMVLGGVGCGVVIAWQLSLRLRADQPVPAQPTATEVAPAAAEVETKPAEPDEKPAGDPVAAPEDQQNPDPTAAAKADDPKLDEPATPDDATDKTDASKTANNDETAATAKSDPPPKSDDAQPSDDDKAAVAKAERAKKRRPRKKRRRETTPKPKKKGLADKARENVDRSW